ncbi:Hypp2230 [Branchiostoma lanceolatum]|uniref:Hypp2230 protein n=1 Tax=Branchiostoma lanceolatum TaxID=7740 RepID=A0A8J9ZSF2_BRALA|nr:Hypp2230 [Branchiostoma lanceolatum]
MYGVMSQHSNIERGLSSRFLLAVPKPVLDRYQSLKLKAGQDGRKEVYEEFRMLLVDALFAVIKHKRDNEKTADSAEGDVTMFEVEEGPESVLERTYTTPLFSKGKGQILRVSAALWLLFHAVDKPDKVSNSLDSGLSLPTVIPERVVSAAVAVVTYSIHQTGLLHGRRHNEDAGTVDNSTTDVPRKPASTTDVPHLESASTSRRTTNFGGQTLSGSILLVPGRVLSVKNLLTKRFFKTRGKREVADTMLAIVYFVKHDILGLPDADKTAAIVALAQHGVNIKEYADTLVDRAETLITDPQDKEDEKLHITSALRKCGYPTWAIEKATAPKPQWLSNTNKTRNNKGTNRGFVSLPTKGVHPSKETEGAIDFLQPMIHCSPSHVSHLHNVTSQKQWIAHSLTKTGADQSKIWKLNPGKASGPDGISPRILKEPCEELADPLTRIFQKSLQERTVPDDWRHANVAPIFKKGQRYDKANYRPISLTCICSKIMEHIVCSNLMKHAEHHNLFYKLQNGFRPGRSCETQLLESIHEVTTNMQNGLQTDVCVLDFSKAFDKVGHKRLIRKLQFYGIEPETLGWIEDFLHQRTQSVVVEGCTSSNLDVLSDRRAMGPFHPPPVQWNSEWPSVMEAYEDSYSHMSDEGDKAMAGEVERLWHGEKPASLTPEECLAMRMDLLMSKEFGQVLEQQRKINILTAQNEDLDFSVPLKTHGIAAHRSKVDKVQQPLTLCKITKARKATTDVTPATERRRAHEMQGHRHTTSGGDTRPQLVRELWLVPRDELQDCTNTIWSRCRGLGHQASDYLNEVVYSGCRSSGHIARNCPKSFANVVRLASKWTPGGKVTMSDPADEHVSDIPKVRSDDLDKEDAPSEVRNMPSLEGNVAEKHPSNFAHDLQRNMPGSNSDQTLVTKCAVCDKLEKAGDEFVGYNNCAS